MKVIAVYSTKGGVGKTTTSVNLAWEAAREHRTLLWDLDPQGASTYIFEVKPKLKKGVDALVRGKTNPSDVIRSTTYDLLDIVPADGTYRDLDLLLDASKNSSARIAKIIEAFADDYDVVILDCPPGESLVARNALHAADVVVIPLTPSPLARRSLDQVRELMADTDSKARTVAFLSMVDRRKSIHRAALSEVPAHGVIAIAVPSASIVERMGVERAPLATFAPRSPASLAFGELWAMLAASTGVTAKKRRQKK